MKGLIYELVLDSHYTKEEKRIPITREELIERRGTGDRLYVGTEKYKIILKDKYNLEDVEAYIMNRGA